MILPKPNQEYIESIARSIQGDEELQHHKLVELMFAIIDHFCNLQPEMIKPGRKKTYSDRLILKLDMLMHLTGKKGETEILREAKRHYQTYFPKLPGQGRLWHRIREALPLIERFRRHLHAQLGVDLEQIRILDSLPIPVATAKSRLGRGNGFDRADGGYCASKNLSYHGFKLGLSITPQGIPDVYDLFPARPHDVRLLDDLLGDATEIIALGDKGFISDPDRERFNQKQAVFLITYRRTNQKQQNSPLEQWALHQHRQLIETVFSQLDGHMHLQHSGAKSDLGLIKRVIGILTAFTLAIFINAILGRHLLNIKSLFA